MNKIIILFSFCALLCGCVSPSPRQLAEPDINRAVQLSDAGEWHQSINVFNEALEIDPNNAYALAERGYARFRAGFLDKALSDIDASLSMRKTAKSYLQRCELRKEMKMYSEAIVDCNQAIHYANAKGLSLDTIEKLKASGNTVHITIGGSIDKAYARLREQAIQYRGQTEKLMGEGAELKAIRGTPHYLAALYGHSAWTPLYMVATNGHIENVKTLLASGADVDSPSNWHGWTPLSGAAGGFQASCRLKLKFMPPCFPFHLPFVFQG